MIKSRPMEKQDLSIGDLSEMTGISVHTLRMWERRYGSPKSKRLPSKHRRYSREEVLRLKAVAKAVEAGHRPNKVVSASLQELEQLLNLSLAYTLNLKEKITESQEGYLIANEYLINSWIEGARQYSEVTLNGGFHDEWARRGPLKFVTECAAPYVEEIGKCWERGVLTISQEHFASGLLSDFLGSMWRRLQERNNGSFCVLASLPGELCYLGLQMVAVIFAITGRRITYLGPNNPWGEIVECVKQSDSSLLALSISGNYNKGSAVKYLKRIRAGLYEDQRILIGGSGAPENLPGVIWMNDLNSLFESLNSNLF